MEENKRRRLEQGGWHVGTVEEFLHLTHEELKAIALRDNDVKAEYDALEINFMLLHSMLEARQQAGLTQASLASGKHSPSVNTLQKYARAVGRRLEIRFVEE
jgi:hypothetical protein